MIVAALDTNIIVSAVISPRGVPSRILDAARAREFTLATSPVIIGEVLSTLGRERIRRKYHIEATDIQRLRDLLERESICATVTHQVHGVATHPEDDLILATALSSQADYLVTGDAQLQQLGSYQGLAIVSPREFLEVIAAEEPE